MHPALYLMFAGFLVVGIFWWEHRRQLARHQGISRYEFVQHFRNVGIVDEVSGAVYDHFRQLAGVRSFQPAPLDSLEGIFKMSGEDLDDELGELLPKLKLEMPHSGILREWEPTIETLSDVVRWVDWVRTKQDPSVTGSAVR